MNYTFANLFIFCRYKLQKSSTEYFFSSSPSGARGSFLLFLPRGRGFFSSLPPLQGPGVLFFSSSPGAGGSFLLFLPRGRGFFFFSSYLQFIPMYREGPGVLLLLSSSNHLIITSFFFSSFFRAVGSFIFFLFCLSNLIKLLIIVCSSLVSCLGSTNKSISSELILVFLIRLFFKIFVN